jgi:hypothetical protein
MGLRTNLKVSSRTLEHLWRFRILGRPLPKVQFLIAGVAKAGTAALDSYLREHPRLRLPDRKETFFFMQNRRFRGASPRSNWQLASYLARFTLDDPGRILGECTPGYLWWDGALERIQKYNRDMKFILLLRDPVERAYSHWNMARQFGRETRPFGIAVREEWDAYRTGSLRQDLWQSYVTRGLYAAQLRRMWGLFPRSQTLAFRAQDLRNHPRATLDRACDFLEVERFESVRQRSVHSRKYDAPLAEADRAFLQEVFALDVAQLEQLLGWDCSQWVQSSHPARHAA